MTWLPGTLRKLAVGKEARAVAGFSFASLVGSLLANRVLTELVPPALLGRFYLDLNVALWLILPVSAGYVYVSRHWLIAKRSGQAVSLVRGIAAGIGIEALICIGATIVIGVLWPRILEGPALLWVCVIAIGQAMYQAIEPIQGAERRRTVAGALNFLASPGRPMLVVAGVACFAPRPGVLLGGYAAGTWVLAAAAVWALARLMKEGRVAPPLPDDGAERLNLRGFIRYASFYFLGVLAMQAAATAERWGLASKDDTIATALFVQASALATAATAGCVTFIQVYYQPIIAQAAGSSPTPIHAARAPLRDYIARTALVLAGVVGTVFVGSSWLTEHLFGPRFEGVEPLLPWTVLAAALMMLGQALTGVAVAAREVASPNLAYIGSRAVYILALVGVVSGGNLALRFAITQVAANLLYVLLVSAGAAWLVRREGMPRGAAGSAG
jgi:hypothetical protein